jgi:hypothetical protein
MSQCGIVVFGGRELMLPRSCGSTCQCVVEVGVRGGGRNADMSETLLARTVDSLECETRNDAASARYL